MRVYVFIRKCKDLCVRVYVGTHVPKDMRVNVCALMYVCRCIHMGMTKCASGLYKHTKHTCMLGGVKAGR